MAYRDDRLALEDRKSELEARLRDVRAKLAEHPSLERELLATIKDLEETYAELNVIAAPARRSLPLLQRIHVASPCNVPWDSMQGDGRVRHCASCDKDVFDLSSLTREQAEALLIEKNGKLCATYYRRADGTILTADCDVGVAKKKKARRQALVAAAALTTTAAIAVAATSLRDESRGDDNHLVLASGATVTPTLPVTETPTSVMRPHNPPTQSGATGSDVPNRYVPRADGAKRRERLPRRPHHNYSERTVGLLALK
ncbi:MAG: hypothetical protein JNK05_18410 [Myxococcales bacterium]|nr:hypothetical protein [Myxococcales bacterium]